MNSWHRWTQEEYAYLSAIVPGRSHREITQLVNVAFGLSLTVDQIKGAISRRKLNTGRSGRFEPGIVSHRPPKGVRYSPATEFKKGHTPRNHKPVGSERVSVEGYVEVKVEEPRKWRMKHVVVWEKANGAVPKGHVVIFADGNRMNLDPNNLLLISRHTLLVANRLGLLSKEADVSRAGIIVSELIAKIEQRQKNTGERIPTRKQAVS